MKSHISLRFAAFENFQKQIINDADTSSIATDMDATERAPSTPARPGSPSPVHPPRPSAVPMPTLTSAFVTALNGSRLVISLFPILRLLARN